MSGLPSWIRSFTLFKNNNNNNRIYTVSQEKTFATPYVSDTLTLGIINSQPVRHFAPHLSSATVLPWEITEHKK